MSLENSYPKKMAIVQHVEFIEKDGTRVGNEITLADGTTLNITIGGISPQLDDTDKLATSIYGTDEAAGDTPVRVDVIGEFPASVRSQLLLEELLMEIKIIKTQLSVITGDVLGETDIED